MTINQHDTDLRILITQEYPPSVKGGIQQTSHSFTRYLSEIGVETDVVYPDKSRFIQNPQDGGESMSNHYYPVEPIYQFWPLDQVPNFPMLKEVLETCTQEELASILIQSPDILGMSAMAYLREYYGELITVLWNSPLDFPLEYFSDLSRSEFMKHALTQPLYYLRQFLWAQFSPWQYRTVFNSETNLASYKKVFGRYPINEFEVIYPTSPLSKKGALEVSDPALIDPRLENRFTFLTVGRITRKKGLGRLKNIILNLDESFDRLGSQNKLGFLVAGVSGSPYSKQFLAELEEMNSSLKNSVCVGIGNPTDDQLETMYNNSDMFIIPSAIEGFGLVTVEAGFHGLPVIGFDSMGSGEVIPKFEDYGHLIRTLSPSLMPEDIARLCNFISLFASISAVERRSLKHEIYEKTNRNFDPILQNQRLLNFLLGI